MMNWAASAFSDSTSGGLASTNVKFGSEEKITLRRTAKRKSLDLNKPVGQDGFGSFTIGYSTSVIGRSRFGETPDFANPHHCGGAFIGGLTCLLCAASVFSVSLWWTFPPVHHRDTENTEVAQRN